MALPLLRTSVVKGVMNAMYKKKYKQHYQDILKSIPINLYYFLMHTRKELAFSYLISLKTRYVLSIILVPLYAKMMR